MNTTKGSAQTSIALSSLANTSTNTYYFTKFVSEPLGGITSITAQTWNYAYATNENNANANFPCTGANQVVPINVYVWRPSDGTVVGTILDGNTAATNSEGAASTETSQFCTFSGSLVSSVQDGDVIIAEVWFTTTQGNTTARTDTFYYDGTTETNATGTTVSNHASYIETPQSLTFLSRVVNSNKLIYTLQGRIKHADTLKYSIQGNYPTTQSNILTKKGTITLDTTSGVHDQSFTGVGFQPKAIIFWGIPTTGTTYLEGQSSFFGFSDGTNHNSVALASTDAATSYDIGEEIANNESIVLLSAATGHAALVAGYVKSFDSDGFTITYDAKDTVQYILHYLAIGGDDITNVLVKQETVGRTTTGNQGHTGYGFQPDMLFFASVGNFALNTLATSGTNLGQYTIGAASSTSQFAIDSWFHDGSGAGNSGESGVCMHNNRVMQLQTNSGGTYNMAANLVSLDSDGYTLNHNSTLPATTLPFICLAIKGGIWECGLITQPTSASTKNIVPQYYGDPEALFLVGSDCTTINSDQRNSGAVDGTICLGGSDNTSEGYVLFGNKIVTSPATPVMISDTAKVIRNATPNATATSSALTAEADSDLTNLGYVNISYTTADSSARQIGYVLLSKSVVSTSRVLESNTLVYQIYQQAKLANTLKYQMQGRVLHADTLKYQVLKQILAARTLKYQLLKQILASRTLKYQLLGRILHAATLKYQLYKQILANRTLKYQLIGRILHANTLKYQLLKQILHSQTLKYQLIGRILHANTLKYQLFQQVKHANIIKYQLLQQIKHANTLKYQLLKQIFHANTVKYNLLQQVLHANTLVWSLFAQLERIQNANTLKYNIIQRQIHSNTLKYNLLKQALHSNTLKYNLLKQILHANSLKYSLIGRILHANTLKYQLLKQALHSNTIKYSLIGRILHANTLKYQLLQQIKHANTIKYQLLKQVLHANTVKYNLFLLVTHSNTLLWNLFATLARIQHANTLRYSLIGRIIHSNTLKYNILKQIMHYNTLRYNLLKQILHFNTLKYNLLKQILHSNILKYNLLKQILHSNTLKYSLLKQILHSNTLSYNIHVLVFHFNSIKYNILQQVLHANTLRYDIVSVLRRIHLTINEARIVFSDRFNKHRLLTEKGVSFSDKLMLSKSERNKHRSLFDSIKFGDNLLMTKSKRAIERSLSDTIRFGDSLTRRVNKHRKIGGTEA